MGALITFLAGLVGRLLGYKVLEFTAKKILLYTLITTILPAVLISVFYRLIAGIMSAKAGIVGTYGSGVTSGLLQLTGLAAWLGNELRLVDGISLLVTAALFRYAMKFVPTTFLP